MHFIIPKQIFDDAKSITESGALPISQIEVSIGYKDVDLELQKQIVTLISPWKCTIGGTVFNMRSEDRMLEHDGYRTSTNTYIVWLW